MNFIKNGQTLAADILEVYIKYYEIVLKDKSKIATRETVESLGGITKVNLNEINVKVTSAISLLYIEFGRRAGAKMPPQGSLDDWLDVKGIDKRFDYIIRKRIAERGIDPVEITSVVIEMARPEVDQLITDFARIEIVGEIAQEMRTLYNGIN